MTILNGTRTLRRGAILAVIMLLGVTLAPVYAQDPLPSSAQLNGLRHEFQTWNNCGGANLTMAMSYFGWTYDQDTARAWLKPNLEDKNVSPGEMAAFVNLPENLPDVRAIWRYGGNLDLIKGFVAAGFPVIVESGFDVDNLGWMGHYETVVAYDDTSQTIWVYDSYLGPSQPHSYTEFDYWWRHFNRTYIVLFPLDRESELRAIMSLQVDPMVAAQSAVDTARQEATANPNDGWAWFNMGTSFVKLGNYFDAATAFDEAFRHELPYRLLWYMYGPFEAYYNVGRYDDVMNLTFNTEETTVYVEEIYYWRGMVYAARGQNDLAINEFNRALSFNPNDDEALTARTQVEGGTFVPPVP
jgi:tetratricopeptide (TPR) repeat protein